MNHMSNRAIKLDTSEVGVLPRPVVLLDKEAERRERKRNLTAALRVFSRYGFDDGVAGHFTVRDPILTDHFWVNPLLVHFSKIKMSDLVLLNPEGQVVAGKYPANVGAYVIHAPLHHARPEIVSSVHAHSIHSRTWSSLGRLLPPTNQDACTFYDDQVVFDPYYGVPSDTSEGEELAKQMGTKRVAFLKHHGAFAMAESVNAAAFLFIALEKCCQSQLMVEAIGGGVDIPDDIARKTQAYLASEYSLWLSFQPQYEAACIDYPDAFDE